ncbi:MAG TPA: hypothetical protein VFE53_24210 [Mucilaginibacter sp.]|jgi:hypothetical protein|nr:hypothetical protein [Mucilaginibacter sp.]
MPKSIVFSRRFRPNLLFLVLSVFLPLFCRAQAISPGDFVKIPVPKPYSADWLKFNQTLNLVPIQVNFVDSSLHITRLMETGTDIDTFKTSNGMFLGVDRGEFGGGLCFKPNNDDNGIFTINGKTVAPVKRLNEIGVISFDKLMIDTTYRYVPLGGGHVHKFFSFHDSLYFIGGIDHMGFDSGSIGRIGYRGNEFSVMQIIRFDDAPHAVCIHGDDLLVATFRKFYIIHNWQKQLLLDNLFWFGFNPTSVTTDGKDIAYVGMYGFYAKIDLKNRTMELFKYNKP